MSKNLSGAQRDTNKARRELNLLASATFEGELKDARAETLAKTSTRLGSQVVELGKDLEQQKTLHCNNTFLNKEIDSALQGLRAALKISAAFRIAIEADKRKLSPQKNFDALLARIHYASRVLMRCGSEGEQRAIYHQKKVA